MVDTDNKLGNLIKPNLFFTVAKNKRFKLPLITFKRKPVPFCHYIQKIHYFMDALYVIQNCLLKTNG